MLRTDTAIRSSIAGRARRSTFGRLSLLIAVALFAAVAIPFAGSSYASPLEQKRAEAQRLAAQIAANNTRIEVLDEQYNESVIRIAQLTKGIASARARLVVAQRHTRGLRAEVRSRAAALYMGASSGTLFPQLDAHNAQEVASRSSYTAAAAARDSTLLSNLRTATSQLNSRQRALNDARGKATQASTQLAGTRDAIKQANTKANSILNGVNSDIRTLVHEAAVAKAKAAEAAAKAELLRKAAIQRQQQQQSFSNGGGEGQQPPANLPSPSGSAAVAISAARAEIGKPYQYAASGPNSFDCSGLTMYAWAHAGVSMAHSSAVQYTEFPHVPMSQLAPGDLVFFGNPIHHVGLFIGGGTMIEAPHTGAFVRYASIYRPDYHGAARP